MRRRFYAQVLSPVGTGHTAHSRAPVGMGHLPTGLGSQQEPGCQTKAPHVPLDSLVSALTKNKSETFRSTKSILDFFSHPIIKHTIKVT